MSRQPRSVRALTLAATASLLAVMGLAGCSGGGGGTDDAATAGELRDRGASGGEGAAPDAAVVDGAPAAEQSPGRSSRQRLEPHALIKTGTVRLESTDVRKALDDINAVVSAHGGEIASESTTTNEEGEEQRSRLELRVPVAEFDETYDEVAGVATLISKNRSQEDVTTQVIDVDARVDSAKQSLESLRRLFVRATRLGQVIALESQLAQRQADLESLLAQQQSLADQTAMSTISVDLSRTPDTAQKPKPDDDQAGFVSGIRQGWDAFTTFVVGVGHALGVALPLGSFFALLALIGWVVVRRRLPGRQPQPTE